MRICEESLIELKARNLFLTEQLSKYEAHMKKASLQFKKQLLVLQDKLIKSAQQQSQQQQQQQQPFGDSPMDLGGNGSGLRLPNISK